MSFDHRLWRIGDWHVLAYTEEHAQAVALEGAPEHGGQALTGDKRWTVDGGTGRSDATLTWGNGSGHISIDWSSKDPRWWSEIYNDDRAALAALVADVQVAARVRDLAAPFKAGRVSDELRRTVARLLAPFLDYNASPIVAADAVLALPAIAADATDAARLRSLAATFDSHLNRDQTYTGAQVAAMLRDGEG